MVSRRAMTTAIAFSLVVSNTMIAEASEGVAIEVHAGTLGVGAEMSILLLENTRLRGGFNYLDFSLDEDIDGIDYEFATELNSFSLLVDWHPFGGAFFLSGGAYINNNEVGVDGYLAPGRVPSVIAQYTDALSISGEVDFNSFAPYLGIGWRSNNGQVGWGMAWNLGVMFQGAPDMTNLRVDVPSVINSIEEVQEYLADQEQKIEDELSWFEYYPVATFQLTYNF
jgi:hypothetical protein